MFHLGQNRVSPGAKSLSVSFLIKELKSSQAEACIMARIIYDRKKIELSTGIRIASHTWCEKKQESKVSGILNKRLLQIRNQIYDAKMQLEQEDRYFTVHDIKNLLQSEEESMPVLLDYCQRFLHDKRKSGECASSTLSKYPATFNYLRTFLEQKRHQGMRLDKWTKAQISAFDSFLKSVTIDERGARMALTTVNKHHVKLKTVFNHAVQQQLIPGNPYTGFKLKFPYKSREYLNTDELDLIEDMDLTHNKTLQKARDLFLFSCYTGLRYQDTQALTMGDVTIINDQIYLRIKQGKTGEPVEIPLLDSALHILKRYTDLPERIIHNKALPQMSNQKANFYLKAVADIAGLQRPLTHHMARHTCATTVLLDNDVPMEITSKFLGHTSMRTTQIYGRITHNQLNKAIRKVNR